MKLVQLQWEFMKDVKKLLDFIEQEGDFIVTGGELFRPYDMQLLYFYGKRVREVNGELVFVNDKRKSWTLHSKHLQRLAIDLNFFELIDGKPNLTYDKEKLQKFGDFWESLSPLNKWGGNWKNPDTPHFQKIIPN